MAKIIGDEGYVYVDGNAVPYLKTFDLDLKVDPVTLDADVADDDWRKILPGVKSWSGKIDFNFETGQTEMWDAALAGALKAFYAYPDRGTATDYWYGSALFSFNHSNPVGGTVAGSASFEGDGVLAKKP